jgi:hypothetical protein
MVHDCGLHTEVEVLERDGIWAAMTPAVTPSPPTW